MLLCFCQSRSTGHQSPSSLSSFSQKILKKIQHLAFTDKVKIVNSYVPEKVKIFIEKNLLDVQLKGQDHYVFINDRQKAQVVFKDGQWIAEHIRTAILKFNYEVDKIDKLLVRDFTDDEVKEYEKTS